MGDPEAGQNVPVGHPCPEGTDHGSEWIPLCPEPAQLQSGEVLAVDESGQYVAATQAEIDSGEYTAVNQE